MNGSEALKFATLWDRMTQPSARNLERRAHTAIVAVVLGIGLGLASCGGETTGGPPSTTSDLTCLSSLASHCCELESPGSAPCVDDWRAARACASWPAKTTLAIYGAPCHGFVAIRVQAATYASLYVYDAASLALMAIGDNAAMSDGSTEIACGAGPSGFTFPRDCSAAWLVASTTSPCDPNAPAATPLEWCASSDDGGAD